MLLCMRQQKCVSICSHVCGAKCLQVYPMNCGGEMPSLSGENSKGDVHGYFERKDLSRRDLFSLFKHFFFYKRYIYGKYLVTVSREFI